MSGFMVAVKRILWKTLINMMTVKILPLYTDLDKYSSTAVVTNLPDNAQEIDGIAYNNHQRRLVGWVF